ncbi:MAG: asparagine synthase (glutamine-hydrolyzing) [Lutibacter sp.]
MCGIAGIIGKNASELVLDKMLLSQKHRGPDFTGKYVSEAIVLGHNRLSIIDLSEEAHQPFYSEDKRFVLVFNGEIYNYLELKETLKKDFQFKTSSDTEVLLAAYIKWGKECLPKLNGMFSFAIWDTQEKKLFAARDRFGIKPFYYHFKNASFYFASEIKALHIAGISKIPKKKVWASYFAYGTYGNPDESFWEGIQQLPGGHYLEFKENLLTLEKWYFFEQEIKKYQKRLPFEDVKETYQKLLEDSIKIHFRADVPVGFNISGGLDSSTLLAFVNKTQKRNNINTYTFYCDNEDYDELPWVEEMIAETKNPLKKVLLRVNELEQLSEEMAVLQDEPFGGIPTIAYGEIFKQAKKDGVKVLLDGQGMDEQWAGYDYYVNKNNSLVQGVNKSPFRTTVLNDNLLKFAVKPNFPKPFDEEVLNLQYRDLFYTKIPRALRFNDRISMGASTELRVPFLDYRLVEFAFAQPLDYKIKNGVQKYLLRELVSAYLSPNITFTPKRPLQTPQREWLGNELAAFVSLQISKINSSEYESWFNKSALKQEWKNYLNGENDSSFHIWQWVSLGLLIKDSVD